jgi:hypothetical protein
MVANSAAPLAGEFRRGNEAMKAYREPSPVADRSPLRSSGATRSIATVNGRPSLAQETIDGFEGQTSVEITRVTSRAEIAWVRRASGDCSDPMPVFERMSQSRVDLAGVNSRSPA